MHYLCRFPSIFSFCKKICKLCNYAFHFVIFCICWQEQLFSALGHFHEQGKVHKKTSKDESAAALSINHRPIMSMSMRHGSSGGQSTGRCTAAHNTPCTCSPPNHLIRPVLSSRAQRSEAEGSSALHSTQKSARIPPLRLRSGRKDREGGIGPNGRR